jgi:hypothetical protein
VGQHFLAPGVEHREVADMRAESAWISRKGQQSFRNGAEEHAVNQPGILAVPADLGDVD